MVGRNLSSLRRQTHKKTQFAKVFSLKGKEPIVKCFAYWVKYKKLTMNTELIKWRDVRF